MTARAATLLLMQGSFDHESATEKLERLRREREALDGAYADRKKTSND